MQGREFNPEAVRYIKLGRGGTWAEQALSEGTVPFGYNAVPHSICCKGDAEEIRKALRASGRSGAGTTQGLREIEDFYRLPDNTLWVTFAHGHLWWAFAENRIVEFVDQQPGRPTRYRPTRNRWSNESLTGERLTTLSLSSALTRTANYRMTICEFERVDYLLRRIRGEEEPLHAEAVALQNQMRTVATGMLAQLHWQDLETLTDLIFSRDGWRRVSVLGSDEPDVDLVLEHVTTFHRAWVQVKTKAGQSELSSNFESFVRHGTCDRFYFVCGQPSGSLRIPAEKHLHLWAGDRLADAAIDAGLFKWLIDRTR